ncbi:uncharacterized protein [Parasteatoda tepidariorum]|uniref:uncharacterized protein isoform X2 n=1 Tax=Parasteatoda tepidariorum TaxID=114398 RepID=UPI0039BD6496
MNSLVLFLGVTLLALCEARPAVHKVTGKLVTHVHKFKEEVLPTPKDGLGLKTNCEQGALVGVGRGLERGISGIINNAAGVVSDVTAHGNLLGIVGGAVDPQGLVDNVDHGLGNGIQALACGVGKIADEVASAGDLLGGAADVVGTAVTSVASTLGDVVGGAVGGVASVISQAVGIIADL